MVLYILVVLYLKFDFFFLLSANPVSEIYTHHHRENSSED